jgi:hypothetical protein
MFIALKTIIPLLLLCCTLGCRAQPTKISASQHFDLKNPASLEQVEAARQRINLVRADMTDEQVFTILGLSDCYSDCGPALNGTTNAYCISYQLRVGHQLDVWHEGLEKPKLISVSLDGTIWRRDENK